MCHHILTGVYLCPTTHNSRNRQTSMPRRDSNPQSQQANGRNPTPYIVRPVGSAVHMRGDRCHDAVVCFPPSYNEGQCKFITSEPSRRVVVDIALPYLVWSLLKPHSSVSPVLRLCALTTHRHLLHASGRYNYHITKAASATFLPLYSNCCRVCYTCRKVLTPVVTGKLHCL